MKGAKMKIMVLLLALLTGLAVTLSARVEGDGKIKLTRAAQVFAFRGPVNESLKDRFIESVIKSSFKRFYVYIDSPGGSVFSIKAILDFMSSSDKEFVCVARYAASAAFMFLEHCDKRYMTRGGIVMSHNASAMVHGDLPVIKSRLRVLRRGVQDIEKRIAKRMRITFAAYKRLIKHELWLTPREAITRHAIDGIVSVNCSKQLLLKKVKVVTTICGIFTGCKNKVTFISACPLINRFYKNNKK